MQENDQYWILISRKLNGEATPQDLAALEMIIEADKTLKANYESLHDIWPLTIQQIEQTQLSNTAEKIISKANSKLGEHSRLLEVKRGFIERYKIWMIAASVIAIVALVFQFTNKPIVAATTTSIANKEIIETPLGQKSKSVLPDGSVVWLNAGSKLEMNDSFGKKIREVSLVGEGYFEIAKNKAIPFIIHTNSIDIKVTGTAFNVKAYPKDLNTETSLIHGSIEVTIKNKKGDKIYMQANDKLIVSNRLLFTKNDVIAKTNKITNSYIIQKLNIDSLVITSNEIQWIENKLIFDDEKLSEILLQMERWYNVKFNINNSVKLDKKYTVDFSKENLTEALEAFKIVKALNYSIDNKAINIF